MESENADTALVRRLTATATATAICSMRARRLGAPARGSVAQGHHDHRCENAASRGGLVRWRARTRTPRSYGCRVDVEVDVVADVDGDGDGDGDL
jgi:hypothetical protein